MSDNLNDITPGAEEHLSKEDKIKAIKRSVKKSANDWDGERSAMFSDKVHKVMDNRLPWDDDSIELLDDMPEDAVPSEEIYAGIGLGDFNEIIPDADIPLFDAEGRPVNGGDQAEEPVYPSHEAIHEEPVYPSHEAIHEEPVYLSHEAIHEEPVYPSHEAIHEEPVYPSHEAIHEETPALAALRQQDERQAEPDYDYGYSGYDDDKSYERPQRSREWDAPQEEPYRHSAPAKTQLTKKKKKRKKTTGEKIRDLFPRKGDSLLECIRKIIFLISIIAIVVCGYLVADYYIDLWHSKNVTKDIMDIYGMYPDKHDDDTTEDATQKYYELLDGARKLLDVNGDVIGVISIPGTPINNPVMKAEDNFKYLDMKINGDESRAGELFMDYRNKFDHVIDHRLAEPNSGNLVIYGHNMGDLTMFGSLQHYKTEENYYQEHPLIYLNSNYESYVYKIFAFFILDSDDKGPNGYDCWNKLDFDSEEDFYKFVNEAKRRTFRLNSVDVKYGDPLLTLSTCNDTLGDRGRFIVMARKVRDGEDAMEGTQDSYANPNVKWPDFYYQIRTNEKYDADAEFVPYGPEKTEE
ncbi:MAG: class B sortase [Ruminococcus flavefaciens]